jgi:hypothetical protein
MKKLFYYKIFFKDINYLKKKLLRKINNINKYKIKNRKK